MPPALPPSPTSPPGRPPLSLVTREHDPVLAPELVDLLAPEPGQTAVDCTFGAGGHARLIAERLGPEGTLIGIDRDPTAQERFNRFAAEAPCKALFVGADFVAGLRALRGEGIRPDMVYMDLGMSSMQIDAWERGFSYSYDAPLDMRMDPRQSFDAADLVNEWPEGRIAQVLRRFGEERHAGGIAKRDRRAAGRSAPPPSWSPRCRRGCPPRPASAAATRPSAPSRRCGSPSTVSSTC